MLNIIVSPEKLEVDSKEITFLAGVTKGEHAGQFVYANTLWLFSEELSYLATNKSEQKENLNMLRNELSKTDNLTGVFYDWFNGSPYVIYLTMEEVNDFEEYYKLTSDPDMLYVLSKEEMKDGTNIGKLMALNNLDLLIKYQREQTQ